MPTCWALTRSQWRRQDSRHLVVWFLSLAEAFAARTRRGPSVSGNSSSSSRSRVAHSSRSIPSASLTTVPSLTYVRRAVMALYLAAGSSSWLSAQTLRIYIGVSSHSQDNAPGFDEAHWILHIGTRSHLVIWIIHHLGTLLGEPHDGAPVLVVKGRLELEIDPIFETWSGALHEFSVERGVESCFSLVCEAVRFGNRLGQVWILWWSLCALTIERPQVAAWRLPKPTQTAHRFLIASVSLLYRFAKKKDDGVG